MTAGTIFLAIYVGALIYFGIKISRDTKAGAL